MKKILAYLLLFSFLTFSLLACSSSSNPAIVVPPPPNISLLQVTADPGPGAGQVTLNWLMVSEADTYNVYYIESDTQPSASQLKTASSITGLTTAPEVIGGLANDHKYWFAVSAKNGNGESALTTAIPAIPSATPPPAAPENVRANAEVGQVRVTWTPVTASPAVTSYNLYCAWSTGSSAGTGYINIPGQASNSYTAGSIEWLTGPDAGTTTGLTSGRSYGFNVTALSGTVESGPSFSVWATPVSANPPPAGPILTAATPGDSEEVTLTWGAVSGATSYNVYLGVAKGVTKANYHLQFLNQTSGGVVTGLTNGSTYYFVVTALNANGESAESNEMSVMPGP